MSWLDPDEMVIRAWTREDLDERVKSFIDARQARYEYWIVDGEVMEITGLRIVVKPFYVRVIRVSD